MPPGDCEFIVNCEFIKAEDNNNIFAIIVFTLGKQDSKGIVEYVDVFLIFFGVD